VISSGYENKKARVEMLPLIDVVFLLLVFFVYAMLSMVVHRGITVELPAASTAEVNKSDYVSITIKEDNTIFVDDARVDMTRLVESVVAQMKENDDTYVFINGDRNSDLGIAIRILDLLREAGIDEVSFECKEEAQ